MNSRLDKLVKGLKSNPVDVLLRIIRWLGAYIVSFAAVIFYYFIRMQTLLVPTWTISRLKQELRPTVRLDYSLFPIFLNADSHISLSRARSCQKEPETVAWIESVMKPGDVFYDVGANIGAYSLVAAKYFQGDLKIHAFEPSFATYYELCKNVVLNDCNDSITPHMIGLSKITGRMTFNYHSLEIGDSLHILGEDLTVADTTLQPVFRQEILAFCINDLVLTHNFPVPTHIKLDVDGTELDILQGADQILSKAPLKSLLVEVNASNGQADSVKQFLHRYGFIIYSQTARGGPYWNYIFSRYH